MLYLAMQSLLSSLVVRSTEQGRFVVCFTLNRKEGSSNQLLNDPLLDLDSLFLCVDMIGHYFGRYEVWFPKDSSNEKGLPWLSSTQAI